jgi:hypothetical protein
VSPSPSPALSAEPTDLRRQADPVSAPHTYPSGVVYGSIPRFGVDTVADALVDAAEYCKLYLPQHMSLPCPPLLTRP